MPVGTPRPSTHSGLDAAASTDPALLKRQSIRGGTITLVSQGASVAIQLASTVVLARLLRPKDYGVIGMVMAITGFAGLFRDLGLSSATIQRDTLSHNQLSTLHWINVAMGAALTAVVAAAAPLVAWFYGRTELTAVTVCVSFNFIIGSFGTQPGALLNRQMRFGSIAAASLSGAVVSFVIAVGMASQGFSYWSLVVSGITGGAITTLMLNMLSGWRPGLAVRGSGVRSMLRYGVNITAFDIVNYFQRNLDNILIGRFWGADALGLYSRAYALLMFPIQNIRGPINSVAFPAMSRLRNRPDLFRTYYLSTTNLVALLSMPLTAFLFVASEQIITVTLGVQWLQASSIFSCLALAAFVQPAAGLAGTLLLTRGESRRYFRCGLFNAIVLSIAFVVGLPWGAVGVALAYAIGNYLVLYPWLRWAFQGSPVTFRDFVMSCAWPAWVSGLAVAAVSVSRVFWSINHPGLELIRVSTLFLVVILAMLRFTSGGRAHMALVARIRDQFRDAASTAKREPIS